MNFKYIFYYLSVLIPLFIIDMIWILFAAKDFYFKNMGFLFQESIKYIPVFFFYLIYTSGILFLAVLPSIYSNSLLEAIFKGALLGLCSYGAYDLTNHATIQNWPFIMTFVDISWGIFVSSISSFISFILINLYHKYF